MLVNEQCTRLRLIDWSLIITKHVEVILRMHQDLLVNIVLST